MSTREAPLLPTAGTPVCGSPVTYVVTLVHGTWAQDAAWTREGSQFCIHLDDELRKRGAASVRFTRCNWPAGDSHEDRRVGSILLHKHLRRQVREFPASEDNLHFVVAHSHGGNVALRTIRRSPLLKSEVSGLVTLATPFLAFSERKYGLALLPQMLIDSAKMMWDFVPLMLLITVPFFLIETLFRWLHFHWFLATISWMFRTSHWLLGHVSTLYSILSSVFTMLIVVGLLAGNWPDKDAIKAYRTAGRRMFRRYSSWQPAGDLGDVRIFSVSSLPDEAYAVLTGSWWIHRVTGWGCRIVSWGAVVILVAGVGGLPLIMIWMYSQAASPAGIWDWHVFVVEYRKFLSSSVMLVAFLLTFVWTKFWLWVFGVTSPGLEFSRPGDNLLLDVRAHRTLEHPGFTCNLRSRFWDLIRHSRFGLFHSRVYSNPQTIAAMAEWIEQCTHKAPG